MIDTLALGLPALTTRLPFHAPELDYFVAEDSVHSLPDAPASYAAEAFEITRRPNRPPTGRSQTIPSVYEVATRMTAAIVGVLRR